MRCLVFDGAPSDKMCGVDIVSQWDVRYALFQDIDTFKGHLIESDIMEYPA
jgi:hypothetical protein